MKRILVVIFLAISLTSVFAQVFGEGFIAKYGELLIRMFLATMTFMPFAFSAVILGRRRSMAFRKTGLVLSLVISLLVFFAIPPDIASAAQDLFFNNAIAVAVGFGVLFSFVALMRRREFKTDKISIISGILVAFGIAVMLIFGTGFGGILLPGLVSRDFSNLASVGLGLTIMGFLVLFINFARKGGWTGGGGAPGAPGEKPKEEISYSDVEKDAKEEIDKLFTILQALIGAGKEYGGVLLPNPKKPTKENEEEWKKNKDRRKDSLKIQKKALDTFKKLIKKIIKTAGKAKKENDEQKLKLKLWKDVDKKIRDDWFIGNWPNPYHKIIDNLGKIEVYEDFIKKFLDKKGLLKGLVETIKEVKNKEFSLSTEQTDLLDKADRLLKGEGEERPPEEPTPPPERPPGEPSELEIGSVYKYYGQPDKEEAIKLSETGNKVEFRGDERKKEIKWGFSTVSEENGIYDLEITSRESLFFIALAHKEWTNKLEFKGMKVLKGEKKYQISAIRIPDNEKHKITIKAKKSGEGSYKLVCGLTIPAVGEAPRRPRSEHLEIIGFGLQHGSPLWTDLDKIKALNWEESLNWGIKINSKLNETHNFTLKFESSKPIFVAGNSLSESFPPLSFKIFPGDKDNKFYSTPKGPFPKIKLIQCPVSEDVTITVTVSGQGEGQPEFEEIGKIKIPALIKLQAITVGGEPYENLKEVKITERTKDLDWSIKIKSSIEGTAKLFFSAFKETPGAGIFYDKTKKQYVSLVTEEFELKYGEQELEIKNSKINLRLDSGEFIIQIEAESNKTTPASFPVEQIIIPKMEEEIKLNVELTAVKIGRKIFDKDKVEVKERKEPVNWGIIVDSKINTKVEFIFTSDKEIFLTRSNRFSKELDGVYHYLVDGDNEISPPKIVGDTGKMNFNGYPEGLTVSVRIKVEATDEIFDIGKFTVLPYKERFKLKSVKINDEKGQSNLDEIKVNVGREIKPFVIALKIHSLVEGKYKFTFNADKEIFKSGTSKDNSIIEESKKGNFNLDIPGYCLFKQEFGYNKKINVKITADRSARGILADIEKDIPVGEFNILFIPPELKIIAVKIGDKLFEDNLDKIEIKERNVNLKWGVRFVSGITGNFTFTFSSKPGVFTRGTNPDKSEFKTIQYLKEGINEFSFDYPQGIMFTGNDEYIVKVKYDDKPSFGGFKIIEIKEPIEPPKPPKIKLTAIRIGKETQTAFKEEGTYRVFEIEVPKEDRNKSLEWGVKLKSEEEKKVTLGFHEPSSKGLFKKGTEGIFETEVGLKEEKLFEFKDNNSIFFRDFKETFFWVFIKINGEPVEIGRVAIPAIEKPLPKVSIDEVRKKVIDLIGMTKATEMDEVRFKELERRQIIKDLKNKVSYISTLYTKIPSKTLRPVVYYLNEAINVLKEHGGKKLSELPDKYYFVFLHRLYDATWGKSKKEFFEICKEIGIPNPRAEYRKDNALNYFNKWVHLKKEFEKLDVMIIELGQIWGAINEMRTELSEQIEKTHGRIKNTFAKWLAEIQEMFFLINTKLAQVEIDTSKIKDIKEDVNTIVEVTDVLTNALSGLERGDLKTAVERLDSLIPFEVLCLDHLVKIKEAVEIVKEETGEIPGLKESVDSAMRSLTELKFITFSIKKDIKEIKELVVRHFAFSVEQFTKVHSSIEGLETSIRKELPEEIAKKVLEGIGDVKGTLDLIVKNSQKILKDTEKIPKLKEEMIIWFENLSFDLDGLKGSLSEFKEKFDKTFTPKVIGAILKLPEFSEFIETARETLDSLKKGMETLEKEIPQIKEEISGLLAGIGHLKTRIDEIKGEIEMIEERLKGIETKLGELIKKIGEIPEKIKLPPGLEENIKKILDTLTKFKVNIDKIPSIEQKLSVFIASAMPILNQLKEQLPREHKEIMELINKILEGLPPPGVPSTPPTPPPREPTPDKYKEWNARLDKLVVPSHELQTSAESNLSKFAERYQRDGWYIKKGSWTDVSNKEWSAERSNNKHTFETYKGLQKIIIEILDAHFKDGKETFKKIISGGKAEFELKDDIKLNPRVKKYVLKHSQELAQKWAWFIKNLIHFDSAVVFIAAFLDCLSGYDELKIPDENFKLSDDWRNGSFSKKDYDNFDTLEGNAKKAELFFKIIIREGELLGEKIPKTEFKFARNSFQKFIIDFFKFYSPLLDLWSYVKTKIRKIKHAFEREKVPGGREPKPPEILPYPTQAEVKEFAEVTANEANELEEALEDLGDVLKGIK